jgi:ubiquinone/menaquinone biosynthesis C-methylase UbiE
LGARDRELRDRFYDGFLGVHYRYVMPFLTLPARPLRLSWPGWIAYAAICAAVLALVAYLVRVVAVRRFGSPTVVDAGIVLLAVAVALFLNRHRYLLNLLILAVPVRLAVLLNPFRPAESFAAVHARHLARFKGRQDRLNVLDVSTGNCSSLYKHGWIELDAELTGVDLSQTMIRQGVAFMRSKKIPMEFVLGDAAELPLKSETFDIVLNYGAINAMSDPARALEEMARVAKKGGLIFFLDEQLFEGASAVERAYFEKVLSSHNILHRCPTHLLPPELANVEVHQVYRFYYICTATKC